MLRRSDRPVRVKVAAKLAEKCGMKLGNPVPLTLIPIIEKALEVCINIVDFHNPPPEKQTIEDIRPLLLLASDMEYEKKFFQGALRCDNKD